MSGCHSFCKGSSHWCLTLRSINSLGVANGNAIILSFYVLVGIIE